MRGLSETFWCNHVFYNDMKQHRPEVRPLIFHRWGGLGSHRYPIGFSGDTKIDYSTLEYEIYFTSTASNVCFGYWGHDLGGHQQGPTTKDPNDPELYLRWMQFGVFSPIFRTHACNDASIERRIWKFSNFNKLRDVVKLRYQFIPYIYTAARQAYDTGVSICRPLYYDYPESDEAYSFEDEYQFGDQILVAPITSPMRADGRAWRQIWLPEGSWFDVSCNKMREGGQTIKEGYTDVQIPYFYKAGCIIPMYASNITHLKSRPNRMVLQVVPGSDGTGTLYEDENNTENYMLGNYATTSYRQQRTSSQTILSIGSAIGYFQGMQDKKEYEIQFLGEEAKPQSVRLGYEELTEGTDWTYDQEKKIVKVYLKEVSTSAGCVVTLDYTSTGIKATEVGQQKADGPMYDLGGRRIAHPQKAQVVVFKDKKVKK